jgi:hypothetical protein
MRPDASMFKDVKWEFHDDGIELSLKFGVSNSPLQDISHLLHKAQMSLQCLPLNA